MPRPDARGLVALSTFATVAFVAPPAAPTPNAMCVQMPQVPAAPSCDWQKQMRNESAPTRRSGIWCGLVRLRFWLTYAMAHLRHPMAMRRQLRSFSLARHSRRRFCLEKLPCQPLPRMRCAACFLPHLAVLPHVSSSLSAYHNAAERSNRMHLSWDEVLASHTRQSSITRRSCITCCGRLPLLFGTDICI